MAETIVIPYCPRPIWRDVIHPALQNKNRAVLVCHRRFGKTVGCVNELIKKALMNNKRAPQYAYIAPYRNQAKRIAWNYLKYFTNVIPGVRVNEAELYVELPSLFPDSPGARIYIIGADHPDSLRGMYLDGVILDEYAQIKQGLYGEVIVPALTDRHGFAYFIGTPKGQNNFYERYQQALQDKDYFVCLYRIDETNIFTAEEIEKMKAEMTDIEIRQELLCDFTASATDIVIPIDLVTAAANREVLPGTVAGMPKILGVDVARYGDDRTVIQYRQGIYTAEALAYSGLSTMEVANRVVAAMNRYDPDMTFIDAGNMGAGVVDRVRQLGYTKLSEVNFGERPMDETRYANLRAEMYFKAKAYLEQGGCIPNDPDLKGELASVEYKFTPTGKIILLPKEKLREITGKSPDKADAFVLTFARPVNVVNIANQRRAEYINQHYDPLGDLL